METRRCSGCMMPMSAERFCPHCGHDAWAQNAVHQLPVGAVLKGQYQVGKVLGQGGFGITYLGWDLYLNIPVAIKEYYPTGLVMRDCHHSLTVTNCEGVTGGLFEHNRMKFLKEAQILARLAEVPEVVHVRGFFPENDTAYIVMEYLRGTTLKEYVRSNGAMGFEKLLELFHPVMEGLQKVHDAGLIHRDISPDNIMILPDGRIKLLDFGAVRDYVNDHASQSVQTVLKHGYAPLEQYRSRAELGPRTDVHALCGTMFYCMTGRVPPDAPERMLDDIPVGWEQVPGLTGEQIRVLNRAMALKEEERIQSVKEFGALLQKTRAVEPVQKPEQPEKPDGTSQEKKIREKKRIRKLPILILLLAVVCAGALLSGKEKTPDTPAGHSTEDLPQTRQTMAQTTEESSREYLFTYHAEDLDVTITKDRVLTATVRDLNLRDSYVVDNESTPDHVAEYIWCLYAYSGDRVLEVSTKHWKDPLFARGPKEMTMEQMDNSLWLSEEENAQSFSVVCDVDSMTHDENSITWVCTIPQKELFGGQFPYDLDAIESFKVVVSEYDAELYFERNYRVEEQQAREETPTVPETEEETAFTEPEETIFTEPETISHTEQEKIPEFTMPPLPNPGENLIFSFQREGLSVTVDRNRLLTIRAQGMVQSDTYPVNQPDIADDEVECIWRVGLTTEEDALWLLLRHVKEPGGKSREMPLKQMESMLLNRVELNGEEAFIKALDQVDVRVENDTIIWQCQVPEQFPQEEALGIFRGEPITIDLTAFTSCELSMTDYGRDVDWEKVYTVAR